MIPALSTGQQLEGKYWEGIHTVNSHEIDFKHYLSLQTLFGLFQDSAYKHVETRKIGWSDLHQKNLFWMIAKIIVRINRRPKWDEKIKIRTWTAGTDGINANRNWVIFDEHGDKIIVGISRWLIVNEKTRRITRLDKNLFDMTSLDEFPFEYELRKIKELNAPEIIMRLHAKNSELDINYHINNTNYIKWIFDSENLDFLKGHEPKEIEINYLKEAIAGIEMKICRKAVKDKEYFYSIFNGENDSARARIKWRKQ